MTRKRVVKKQWYEVTNLGDTNVLWSTYSTHSCFLKKNTQRQQLCKSTKQQSKFQHSNYTTISQKNHSNISHPNEMLMLPSMVVVKVAKVTYMKWGIGNELEGLLICKWSWKACVWMFFQILCPLAGNWNASASGIKNKALSIYFSFRQRSNIC